MSRPLKLFRRKFNFPSKSVLQWFPGHMGKGMKQIEQKLKNVDCLIEVHDARIPFSGRNTKFKYLFEAKPHVLILNKKDLIDKSHISEIVGYLRDVNEIIFTNCKDQNCPGVRRIIPRTTELISNSNRYNRSEVVDYNIMVLGVPNVGKSSLINILRNKYLRQSKATSVGPIAGVTKSVLTKIKVCNKPEVYLLDTPGILAPNISNLEEGLKLALVSTMKDHLVGPQIIADYLLFWLNKHENFSYVEYLGLKEPSDVILEVLTLSAVNLNKTIRKRNIENGGIQVLPDLDSAAYHFIEAFRHGKLGKIMLD